MSLDIDDFRNRMPKLPKIEQAFVIGHKVALETVVPNDGSWERSMLSRLIMHFAWLKAWQLYVETCDGKPLSFDQWKKLERV